MGNLIFEPNGHKYFLDGVELPSVTRIIREAGLYDPSKYAEGSCDRGRNVHQIIQYYDENDLDEASVYEGYRPYLEGYKRFLAECRPKWELIEKPVYDPILGYAGTFDRFGTMLGKKTLLDLKSGAEESWHPIQTAAYCVNDYARDTMRYALYLDGQGNYRLIEHTNRRDFEVFKAALLIYKWRQINGQLK